MNPIRGLQNSQYQDTTKFTDYMKHLWTQVPTFCRMILATTTIVYLLSWISMTIPSFLQAQPSKILYQLQIWRLVTGVYVHTQLVQLIMNLLGYIMTAMVFEKQYGTVKQTFRFLTTAIVIEMLFVVTCWILSIIFNTSYINMTSMGLLPVLFCDMVIQCNKNPDSPRLLCCLPIEVKSKYFPWIIMAFFSLFFGIQIDILLGMAAGYLHLYGKLQYFELSNSKAKSWETQIPFKFYLSRPEFVTVDNASDDLPTFVKQTNTPQSNSSSTSTFKAFQGAGVKLGSGTSDTTSSASYGTSIGGQEGERKGLLGKSEASSVKSDDIKKSQDEGHEMKSLSSEKPGYTKVIEFSDDEEEEGEDSKIQIDFK